MRTARDDHGARVRACLMGGAIGDALGAGVEFASYAGICRSYGGPVTGYVSAYGRLGAITDDTQMTLFAVEGLVESAAQDPRPTAESAMLHVRDSYLRWYAGQLSGTVPAGGWLPADRALSAARAPGNTCMSGLGAGGGTTAQPVNAHSKGCGTVMRAAPYGLLTALPEATRRAWAIDDAALTHGHPTAWAASAALTSIISGLFDGLDLRAAVAHALDSDDLRSDAGRETSTALQRALTVPAAAPVPGSLGEGWVGDEALAIAVWCAVNHDSAAAAMLAAVNHDGDSDSTGAICGQLLGAAAGQEFLAAVPQEWIVDNEATDLVTLAASRLMTAWA